MIPELTAFSYQNFLKPILFSIDPEKVHDSMTSLGEHMGESKVVVSATARAFNYTNQSLEQNIFGINFKNPVGLAAGFDKNARLTQILPALGFGFEEVGSVTLEANSGNPKPRLGRLPQSQGLVVHYGLPNFGIDKILEYLSIQKPYFPIGISVAKTNSPRTADKQSGIADYVACFQKTAQSGLGSYITLNISCPNAYGGEPFTKPHDLDDLLHAIREVPNKKPLIIKMPLDVNKKEFHELLLVCKKHHINGIIVSNLTKQRESPAVVQEEIQKAIPSGGISGRPCRDKSNELIEYAYKHFKNDFIIIGCGGIFSAEDAYAKIRRGASLVQLITGLIFKGPQLVCQINQGLAYFLQRDGFSNISEAVGADNN